MNSSIDPNFYITMLPTDTSSTVKKSSYNDPLHGEIVQSEFLQILENAPCELYVHVDDLLSPKNSKRSRYPSTKSYKKAPRNQNAFILYRRNESARRKKLGSTCNFKLISKEISTMWQRESTQIKIFFQILATEASRRHRLKYPGYKYNPAKRNNKECHNLQKKSYPKKNSEEKEKLENEIVSENNLNIEFNNMHIENVEEADPFIGHHSLFENDLHSFESTNFFLHDPIYPSQSSQSYDQCVFFMNQQPLFPLYTINTIDEINVGGFYDHSLDNLFEAPCTLPY